VCGSILLILLRCGTGGAPPPEGSAAPAAGSAESAKLVEMLQDPLLWGPDYPAAINSIPAFAQAGERSVEVRSRRVVGAQKYARSDQARAAAAARAAMEAPPRVAHRMLPGSAAARTRRVQSIEALIDPDDRALHVGTPDHTAQYIAPNVRIDEVIARFGKPDGVTVNLLDDGTERRPIQQTRYHYAGDRLIVVTADVNDDPRRVDRVLIDTGAVLRAIF